MNKTEDSINHQIDGLILALEERKGRYDKMMNKVRKEAEYKALYKIMLHHTCSINMLKGVKELLNC